LSTSDIPPSDAAASTSTTSPVVWLLLGLALLLVSGAVGYFSFAPAVEPPPAEILNDPFLLEGRSIYLSRCVTCHGASGKGDGPMSASLGGEQVGDLSDGEWKHGGTAEDVLRVVRAGVPGTRMAPWGPLLEEAQLRSVAAYCYVLSKQPVPDSLRETDPAPSFEPR